MVWEYFSPFWGEPGLLTGTIGLGVRRRRFLSQEDTLRSPEERVIALSTNAHPDMVKHALTSLLEFLAVYRRNLKLV